MTQESTRGLLVVDVQTAFHPPSWLIAGIGAIVDRYAVTVATHFTNPPGSLYRTRLDWHGCGPGANQLVIPFFPDYIVEKTGYGLPAEEAARLAAMQVSGWDICGLETDACVLACAMSLWDAGVPVCILEDLCASPNAELHAAALKIAKRSFGGGEAPVESSAELPDPEPTAWP